MALQKMTPQEIEELTDWLLHIATCTDPLLLRMPPDVYKPVAAWLQMSGAGLVDCDSDMKPWNMPQDLVDFYCDVWFAAKLATMRAARREPPTDFKRGGGPLFGGDGGPNDW